MDELKELDGAIDLASNELNQMDDDLNLLQQKKANYLGKKGIIANVMSNMKNLSNDERKELGMKSNKIKMLLED